MPTVWQGLFCKVLRDQSNFFEVNITPNPNFQTDPANWINQFDFGNFSKIGDCCWHNQLNLKVNLAPNFHAPNRGTSVSWHRDTWFETQQWQGVVIKSMFYTSKDEKPTIFSAQKGPNMSKTFAPPPSCCWSPLRADTKQRGGEVLVTKQMMKIYGTMGNLWKL